MRVCGNKEAAAAPFCACNASLGIQNDGAPTDAQALEFARDRFVSSIAHAQQVTTNGLPSRKIGYSPISQLTVAPSPEGEPALTRVAPPPSEEDSDYALPCILSKKQDAVRVNAVSGFVTTNKGNFSVNGKRWYAAGTNAFYAAQYDLFTTAQVDTMLQMHAANGTTVLRVFAFTDGYGTQANVLTPNPIQPRLGVYNETVARRLDYVVNKASQLNMRVILTLTNWWPFYGGMRLIRVSIITSVQFYVDSLYNTTAPEELFYTDTICKAYFKSYVGWLIRRTNFYSGLKYINDPAVLAWELSNEARTTNGYEASKGVPLGSIINSWVSEMSSYIKSLDKNHLVSTGQEGFQINGDCCNGHTWMNNGLIGTDWITTNTLTSTIDFATIHLYPSSWGFTTTDYTWLGPNWIVSRAVSALAKNKPILLEEYGLPSGWLPCRDGYFAWALRQAHQAKYTGSLAWQALHTNSPISGVTSDFTFSYTGDGGNAVQFEYLFAKFLSSYAN
ncbi:hypothetical protein QBZ16_003283 [Prototheca wickerhamii]|uniref:mannan endo-1,4-beta-mannosidase n=1 Tax=Prototheca wickerhamii TaxID=3111 RepID=A0AAD9IHN2_PROWI|nr:hypothetical protein QBZ16_003283 [Prototheca wickerhamii]